jgi:hypothetical protein
MAVADEPKNPCNPSPCKANTNCQVVKNRPVCSCIQNYLGDPATGCRPECTINSDCPAIKSCYNRQCVDPCAGKVCGINAECRIYDHTAICECPEGFVGNAFYQCISRPMATNISREPCQNSPCGPHMACSVYGNDVAICDPCAQADAHNNPMCGRECIVNSDCPFDKACLGQKCSDPCPGSCGHNAVCVVVQHNPVCSCPQGLRGNPYEYCSVPAIAGDQLETCNTITCGANTECRQKGGVLACVCLKGYYGNPLIGCRPECVISTDCPMDKACVNNKCLDPCPGTCGVGAICDVVNHYPVCHCPPGYTGDAFISCSVQRDVVIRNPCDPSPCGSNSKCLERNGYAICSCLDGYKGRPPFCQPECTISAECPQNRACINFECRDPCPGTCGVEALCEVLNHSPICTCRPGYEGNPFEVCRIPEQKNMYPDVEAKNPCSPSPCGPNSVCQINQNRPVCSCFANFIGQPPYCRPECVLNNECPQDKACIREKCIDPCQNSCGQNAECHVINHAAHCSCIRGYQGDAFVGCSKIEMESPPQQRDVCYPSPCGENAQCTENNGAYKCSCIPPYIGNPYTTCRPECILNSECSNRLACINQHCRDPCVGICGTNAVCEVANHAAVCSCQRGYTGDPFVSCRQISQAPIPSQNLCEPSPCGPNSVCRILNGRPVCSCQSNFLGSPPNCRPECVVSSECPLDLACIKQKCRDPCPGTCGSNAKCQVVNHNPICSCPSGYIGDPFVQCQLKRKCLFVYKPIFSEN